MVPNIQAIEKRVAENETVTKMSFVFRDISGTVRTPAVQSNEMQFLFLPASSGPPGRNTYNFHQSSV